MLCQGPTTVYRLLRGGEWFCGVNQLHPNTVYPFLKRYLQRGWITRKEEPGQRGRTRSVCTITPAGRAALVEKVKAFSTSDAGSADAFRLCVGLFGHLEKGDRQQILAARDRYLQYRIEELRELDRQPGSQYWSVLTTKFLVHAFELERKWINELIRSI